MGTAPFVRMDHPARILVVDDDADLRRLIGDFLASHGFLVNQAADGDHARRAGHGHRPHRGPGDRRGRLPRQALQSARAAGARARGAAATAGREPGPANGESSLYEFAGWRLDVARRDLRDPSSAYIDLIDGEFALLRCFVQSPQRVLNRDQLLDQAHGGNRDTGGIGLGLATARAIELDHGGEITLANRNGGGLRVTVRLPMTE